MYFNASFFLFSAFLCQISRFFLRLSCRLLYLLVTPSGVEPSHANRGEWCAARYPHGLPAA